MTFSKLSLPQREIKPQQNCQYILFKQVKRDIKKSVQDRWKKIQKPRTLSKEAVSEAVQTSMNPKVSLRTSADASLYREEREQRTRDATER